MVHFFVTIIVLAENYPADAIIKHFTIMAGPCNANKTKDELKKEFKAKMKDDIMIKYLFCTRSQCDVTDIEVTCSRSRKRSVGTLRIEFDVITVPDLPTNQSTATFSAFSTFSSVQDLQRIEAMLRKQIEATIKRLQGYLQQLENQVLHIWYYISLRGTDTREREGDAGGLRPPLLCRRMMPKLRHPIKIEVRLLHPC